MVDLLPKKEWIILHDKIREFVSANPNQAHNAKLIASAKSGKSSEEPSSAEHKSESVPVGKHSKKDAKKGQPKKEEATKKPINEAKEAAENGTIKPEVEALGSELENAKISEEKSPDKAEKNRTRNKKMKERRKMKKAAEKLQQNEVEANGDIEDSSNNQSSGSVKTEKTNGEDVMEGEEDADDIVIEAVQVIENETPEEKKKSRRGQRGRKKSKTEPNAAQPKDTQIVDSSPEKETKSEKQESAEKKTKTRRGKNRGKKRNSETREESKSPVKSPKKKAEEKKEAQHRPTPKRFISQEYCPSTVYDSVQVFNHPEWKRFVQVIPNHY